MRYDVTLLTGDALAYGGSGAGHPDGVKAVPVPAHSRPYSVELTLPPLGVLFLHAPRRAPELPNS